MADIQEIDSLIGKISAENHVNGSLSGGQSLGGVVNVIKEYDPYVGNYEVTPLASTSQTLETANKVLLDDITVNPVPYYETSNLANGLTAYIAEEVE